MEMTDLERAWQGLDQRLAGLEQHARQQRVHRTMDSVRWRLRLVTLGQLLQLAIGIVIVVVAGPYWIRHLDQPHLAVYGIAIHLYGLALLLPAVMQLLLVLRLDYRRPVLEVQSRLLTLSRVRVCTERWLLMAGFVAWVPFVFAMAAAGGLDVWVTRPGVVLANLAVGLAMAAGVGWLTLRFRDRFACDATGRSLVEAEKELAALLESDGPR